MERDPAASPEIFYQFPEGDKKPSFRWRLLVAGAFLGMGLVAAAVGIASITYRLTHLTIDTSYWRICPSRAQIELLGTLLALEQWIQPPWGVVDCNR